MAKLVYKCRVCKKLFRRETLRGRLPRACPEHRHLVKGIRDRKRVAGERSPCCAQLGPGRVCEQHKQFRGFKQYWVRTVKREPMDPVLLAIMDLFYQDCGDGGEDAKGPVYRRKPSGFNIVTLGRGE
jgi:DNA-directed RNA polymerase subunit RPC12/RpoP